MTFLKLFVQQIFIFGAMAAFNPGNTSHFGT